MVPGLRILHLHVRGYIAMFRKIPKVRRARDRMKETPGEL